MLILNWFFQVTYIVKSEGNALVAQKNKITFESESWSVEIKINFTIFIHTGGYSDQP